ncbi:MAG: PaaI family thioesterase [Sulfolobales archaeon]
MRIHVWGDLVSASGSIAQAIESLRSSGKDLAALFNEVFLAVEPVYRNIGIEVKEIGRGYAKAVFNMSENIARWGGVVNGGVIMTVIDMVIGISVMTVNDGIDQYTAELKVNFLEPLRTDPFTAIGRVIRKGGTLVVGEGEIYDGENRLCAKGIGTWFIVKRRNTG